MVRSDDTSEVIYSLEGAKEACKWFQEHREEIRKSEEEAFQEVLLRVRARRKCNKEE